MLCPGAPFLRGCPVEDCSSNGIFPAGVAVCAPFHRAKKLCKRKTQRKIHVTSSYGTSWRQTQRFSCVLASVLASVLTAVQGEITTRNTQTAKLTKIVFYILPSLVARGSHMASFLGPRTGLRTGLGLRTRRRTQCVSGEPGASRQKSKPIRTFSLFFFSFMRSLCAGGVAGVAETNIAGVHLVLSLSFVRVCRNSEFLGGKSNERTEAMNLTQRDAGACPRFESLCTLFLKNNTVTVVAHAPLSDA